MYLSGASGDGDRLVVEVAVCENGEEEGKEGVRRGEEGGCEGGKGMDEGGGGVIFSSRAKVIYLAHV